MSQGPRYDRPAVASSSRSRPRAYIPPAILNELHHLDLSGRVSLDEMEVVGLGAYGDVLKSNCELENRGKVAVAAKRLRFYLKEDIETMFNKEVYVWSKLKHDNVLALLGFAFDEPHGFPLLISEWMANGSSLNYVRSNSGCDLMHLVTGIAAGLAYLHDQNVVHSDIKPDNIVVTDTGDARICDFGGSRIAAASKSMAKLSTGIRGTPQYLSYELVAFPDQHTRHTKESDIWAFGMTIYALLAQEHPFALYAESHVLKAIADREVPSFNFWTPRSSAEKAILHNICHLCWEHDPKLRAVMSFIASSLRDSGQHRNASRPLDTDNSERRDAKRRRVIDDACSESNGRVQLNNNGIYEPLDKISLTLDTLNRDIKIISEAYQYLRAAKKVTSLLYHVFVKDFKFDGKLDQLMRAMRDVLIFIVAGSTVKNIPNEERTIMRLVQQVIECCLFIIKYSQKSFEDRKLRTSEGRKMSEFISFFVTFKEVLQLGTGVSPTFTSSRVGHSIDETVLRQRLNPNEADTKGQQRCLLGTRVAVQEQIIEWALSESGHNILWLHGVAGSGKSTVITSVAEHFRGIYRLGAFLQLTSGASNPSSVISTIAFKLALFDSTIGSLILAETERDKDIANASLSTQFEKLLLDPLTIAANAQQGPVIIILDALDECGTPATRKIFMQVFLRGLRRLPLNFKFLFTSRREQDIDRAFNSHPSDSKTILELDYTSHISRSDVQSYLAHEIRNFIEDGDIPKGGTIERQLLIIGNTAAGLFVLASTIVKLVSEHDSPLEKLAEIALNVRSFSGLNQLYSTVLVNSGISWYDGVSKSRFQRVIGLILLSKTPLTEDTIDEILGPSVGKCRGLLSRLRSVIDYKPGEPVRFFHTSFSDYLMSSGHTEDWFVDVTEQESFLAMRCFEIMKVELRFNICDLETSFVRNDVVLDIEDRIESRISQHVSYACSHWAHHLCEAPYGSVLIHELAIFLYSCLLYWLEVMSLLKKVGTVGPMLLATTKWIGNNEIELTTFMRDARRLVTKFVLPISQSVPHIYLSMLPFTANESRVSAHYLQYTSSLVRVVRKGVKMPSPLLNLLKGHTGRVTTVGFSQDGSLIVSGSADETVRLWDTERGEHTAGPFKAHIGWITSVTFSPDGTRIVIGGDSGICVLDVESGHTLVGPFGYENTKSIAISPDGKHIVSASLNAINVWDIEYGTIVGDPFIGHTDEVLCVTYSRDGRFIASGSSDRSVRVWDVKSRGLVREPFLGHARVVFSVAFSPDRKYIVSCSWDKTIRIWDVERGEVDYSPLNWHGYLVMSAAYSSDGTRVVSCSWDKTVILWNAQNGQRVALPFKYPSAMNCVAFSPDGTRVVSGSCDKTLQIWDAEPFNCTSAQTDNRWPERVRDDIIAVKFSSNNICVNSDDETTWRIEDGVVVSEGVRKQGLRTLEVTNGMQFSFSEGDFDWNYNTGDVTSALVGNLDFPNCIAVSPNKNWFAFGSRDGSIRIWDEEHDMLVCRPFNTQGREVKSLTFSPDGKHIVSGSNDVRVWEAGSGKLLFGPFAGHTDDVYSVAYAPHGRQIVTGSADGTARVWDIKTGRSEVFKGHNWPVRSVSYSPDGSRIVSYSRDDFEIRVWKTSMSEVLAPTDQGQLLASSNIDLSTWTLDQDGWIRGVHDEHILWIPLDLRSTLSIPPNIAIINRGFSTSLDFSGSAQGEDWHKCFSPLV